MDGAVIQGDLLLDLPVQLSEKDYCSAALLYQRLHGSPFLKKAMIFLILTISSAMISCILFALLAGGGIIAVHLVLLILLFCVVLGGGYFLEQRFLLKNAAQTYQSSQLLRQKMAVRFYQHGVSSLSPNGRHLFLWDEVDGALENEWGIILYKRNNIIALPGSALDSGALHYLHGLLSVKLGHRYRIERFVLPTGDTVDAPLPEAGEKDIPPDYIFFEVCAVQNSPQWEKRQKLQWIAIYAAISLLFGVFCFVSFVLFDWIEFCYIAGAAGFLLCFFVFLFIFLYKNKTKKDEEEQIMFLRFAPTGMEVEQKRDKFFIPWRLIDCVRKKENGFLIEYDGHCNVWIEKSTLFQSTGNKTKEELFNQVENIFKEYMPSEKNR